MAPAVYDQTLGVACLDCNRQVAVCWGDEHIPESLWNRACGYASEYVPCDQDRHDVCALCEEEIV